MKAFILAAGVGSRLRPLTDATAKALIPVAGVPMLERVFVRLRQAGATSFVVNVHHHAEQVAAFCADLSRRNAVPVAVSREDDLLLDTGGAVRKAAALLRGRDPFFLHNADVLSDVDLKAMYAAHREADCLATLAVRRRESARAYLFDGKGRFAGHDDATSGRVTWAKAPAPDAARLAFDGIHVISPALLDQMTESGVFSITKTYLRLAAAKADIRAFRTDAWSWHDIGSPEKLAAAQSWAANFSPPRPYEQ